MVVVLLTAGTVTGAGIRDGELIHRVGVLVGVGDIPPELFVAPMLPELWW